MDPPEWPKRKIDNIDVVKDVEKLESCTLLMRAYIGTEFLPVPMKAEHLPKHNLGDRHTYPPNTCAYEHQETCKRLLIAALFLKAKERKNPNVHQPPNGQCNIFI